MLKLAVVAALTLAVAYAEPPVTEVKVIHHHHHHGERGHSQHGLGSHVKVRQGGPSKIFGWLGSRFSKIPHYMPRFPQFPRSHQAHKLPQYHALIIPDPPKSAGHYKVRGPEKVKITHIKSSAPVTSSNLYDIDSLPELSENSYSPAPVSSSYSIAETIPQIEVVPSTLLYQKNQIIPTTNYVSSPAVTASAAPLQFVTPGPAVPIAAPPLLSYSTVSQPQTQSYSVNHHQGSSYAAAQQQLQSPSYTVTQQQAPSYTVTQQQQPSYTLSQHQTPTYSVAQPSVVRKPILKQQSGVVPIVPQSTGPDYFDTAYKGGSSYNKAIAQQAPQQHIGLGTAENNYGAKFEIQSQGTSGLSFGTPILPQQQSYSYASQGSQTYSAAPQPSQSYSIAPQSSYQAQAQLHQNSATPQQATQIEQYANQALNAQSLDSLLSSFSDSGAQNNYGAYSQLTPQVAAPPTNHVASESQQQAQLAPAPESYSQSSSSASGIPGVQILSQGTDGGNPVFEVIADANAPSYDGHPFDINKLISLIEPGAQLESAELSQAASETKSTYTVPASATTATTTSGTNDLLLSNSSNSSSSSNSTEGSNSSSSSSISNGTSSSSNDSDHVTPKPLSLPLDLTATAPGNESRSSLKEIMDFFQQTGGKGYVVVEKKRHRPDNLTLDFDQTSDTDDLINGPTRVNITSDMIYSQLQLLNEPLSTSNNNTNSNKSDKVAIPRDSQIESTKSVEVPPVEVEDALPPLLEYPYTDQYADEYESYYSDPYYTSSNNESVQQNLIILDTNKLQKTENAEISSQGQTSTSTSTLSPITSATPQTQLTTLFEPVTSGKPAVFATSPTSMLDGETLNPNHNYFGDPSLSHHNYSTEYPLLGHSSNSGPTINPFLDAVDESVLDEPVVQDEEDDLSAAESQQVRSIAITVTPPPQSSTEKGRGKGAATTPATVAVATTTTQSGNTTELDPLQFLASATKKPSSLHQARPAPVYRGKKSN